MKKSLNRVLNLILLLLYILPLCYLVSESFGYAYDSMAPLWIGALCLAAWISADFKHGVWLGLPVSLAILYLAYRLNATDAALQFKDAFDKFVGAYYEHIYAPGKAYSFSDFAGDHSLVLLLLGFLLSAYLASALSARKGRILFSLIGSVPAFVFCIAVNGRPSPAAVFCLLLFWTLLLVGGGHYDPHGAGSRAVLTAVIPVMLVLGLLLVNYKPSSYEFTGDEAAIRERFDGLKNFISRFSQRLDGVSPFPLNQPDRPTATARPSPSASGSGPSYEKLDLSAPYDFDRMNDVILRVRADTGGRIYLRGRSYGDYEGKSWAEAEEPPLASSLSFAATAARNAGAAVHEIRIRPVPPSGGMMFAPYFCTESGGTDTYLPLDRAGGYNLSYVNLTGDFSSYTLPDGHREAELQYRDYAHGYYTRLPSGTKAEAEDILLEAGLSADSPDIVSQVAAYVQQIGTYDLHTPAYPSSDHAIYFLTQARQGYCIHFATAAAVLYRALGIPARVTEGYAFQASPGDDVDVLGSDAHAWVEVYCDGLGWLPVEVTGAGGSFGEESGSSPSPAPSQAPETDTPAPPEASPSLTAPPTQPPSPSPSSPLVGLVSPEEATAGPGAGEILRSLWRGIRVLLALGLAAAFLPLRRVIRLGIWRRRMTQADSRRAAVAIWRAAGKVAAFGTAIPPAITGCAEKAAFGRNAPSRQELSESLRLLEEMKQSTYAGLSRTKRFVFKYVNCIM